MRVFEYNDYPSGIVRKTEKEIIDEYYEFWKSQMRKVQKEHMISKENCIEDWKVIHWAWQVE